VHFEPVFDDAQSGIRQGMAIIDGKRADFGKNPRFLEIYGKSRKGSFARLRRCGTA
jgi:hypothetical protein